MQKRNPRYLVPSAFILVAVGRGGSGSSSWCLGFGVQPQWHYYRDPVAFLPRFQTENSDNDDVTITTDITIPYDAAARLAYKEAGNPGDDYESFKEKYESEAVADVIRKRNNNNNQQEDQQIENEEGESAGESDQEDEDSLLIQSENDNEQVVELQQKLRQWMEKEKKVEDEYRSYLVQKALDEKIPPIYEREGKIDHYKARPIYDKETEELLTELWTIQSRIKLTRAKIVEERRVDQVRQETADRIANFDDEIAHLEDQFEIKLAEVEDAKARVQDQADETIKALKQREEEMKSLAKQLEEAKQEQERIRQKGEKKLESLQQEHQKIMKNMREESENQLSEKDRQIESLKQEIRTLLLQLQDKRNRLDIKESDIVALETDLKEKESIIAELNRERASLRTLVGLSWKVLKKRFKKRVLRRRDDVDSPSSVDDDGTVVGQRGEQMEELEGHNEKNAVGSQARKAR